MGDFNHEMKVGIKIPPARMFDELVSDDDHHILKGMVSEPMAIQNIELIEGDGGPGSIKKIIFGEAARQAKYEKHKIEAMDKKSFSVNYSLIEGPALMNNLEKISYDFKFMATPDGGSICCISCSKHYTFGDIYIKEEDIKAEKGRALGLIKAVEAYLLANRDAAKIKVD